MNEEFVSGRGLDIDRSGKNNPNYQHGHYVNRRHSPEYESWTGMISRCYNSNHKRYSDYDSRGIRVHDTWRKNFMAFLTTVGPKPSRQHSLDRINTNGDYTPDNIRWATVTEQNNNRRDNIFICIDGRSLTPAQWSRISGVKYSTIYSRLRKGWIAKEAVFTTRYQGPRISTRQENSNV